MIDRRSLLLACSAVPVLATAFAPAAQAYEFHPYDEASVAAAIKSGKPVIVHVYAPWCLQCRAQAANLASMQNDPQLDRIAFFKVDYDDQKSVVAALNVPRSTLIGYKGGKEVARMSWGTSRDDVIKIIQAVY
jgi:thioredoxin 1